MLGILLVGCGKIVDQFGGEEAHLSKQDPNLLNYLHKSINTFEVRVFYEPNAEPYAGKFINGNDVWGFLEKNLKDLYQDKRPGLEFVIPKKLSEMNLISAQGRSTWDANSLLNLRDQVGFGKSTSTQGQLAIFFLNGFYEGNAGIIGIHLGGTTVIGIFKDVIKGMTMTEGQQTKNFVEQITVVHEIGHALGLVNLGVAPQSAHHSSEHPGHCTNDQCVMFWANRGKEGMMDFVRSFITTGKTTVFGNQCLVDFQAH